MRLKIALLSLYLAPSLCAAQVKKHLDSLATYPCIGFAISQHESARGKSVLAKNHNNMFGMKGKTHRIGKTPGGYSKYSSVLNSVLAYVEFESKLIQKYNLDTSKKYLTFVSDRFPRKPEKSKWLQNVKSYIKNCP